MGEPFIYNELEEIIITGNYEWLWFVHHETSTGMLNDLDELNTLCNENQNETMCRLYKFNWSNTIRLEGCVFCKWC